MGSNREIKSDGEINITSTRANVSGDLDVTGSINNFTFPGSDGLDGQALVTNGAGALSFADSGTGGGSGVNYITNPRATTDTTGYATYADAAATTPADGTGGSANITFTRNTTTPLRDGGDFKITKDAANRQGEGASFDFTIDNADKAKKHIISFDYDASHASYADDDVRIYIYDVTNTNLIRVNGEELKGGKGKHYAQFQSASDSTSYRLIFHVSSTNASAYDVYLDEVSVGPQGIHNAAISGNGSDVAFIADTNAGQTIADDTITIIDFEDVEHDSHNAYDSGTYTVPVTGLYQINSSIMFGHTSEVDISESMYIALKVNGTSKRIQNWKEGELTDSATLYYSLQISCLLKLNKGDEITIQVYQATGVPYDLHHSNAYNSLDIHKIGSQVTAGGGSDVVFIGTTDVAPTVATATYTAIDFINVERDSHGAFSGGTYTVPESGTYKINSSLLYESTNEFDQGEVLSLDIKVGGAVKRRGHYKEVVVTDSNSVYYTTTVNATLELNKGDEVTIEAYQNSGVSLDLHTSNYHNFCDITKQASPQTVLENETVAMRYTSDAAATISNNTNTTLVFEDKDTDTHNAYNNSTGVYTFPVSGYYSVDCKVGIYGRDSANSTRVYIASSIDGSGSNDITLDTEAAAGVGAYAFFALDGSYTKYFNKGQTIEVFLHQNTGSSQDLYAGGNNVFLSIIRIK